MKLCEVKFSRVGASRKDLDLEGETRSQVSIERARYSNGPIRIMLYGASKVQIVRCVGQKSCHMLVSWSLVASCGEQA